MTQRRRLICVCPKRERKMRPPLAAGSSPPVLLFVSVLLWLQSHFFQSVFFVSADGHLPDRPVGVSVSFPLKHTAHGGDPSLPRKNHHEKRDKHHYEHAHEATLQSTGHEIAQPIGVAGRTAVQTHVAAALGPLISAKRVSATKSTDADVSSVGDHSGTAADLQQKTMSGSGPLSAGALVDPAAASGAAQEGLSSQNPAPSPAAGHQDETGRTHVLAQPGDGAPQLLSELDTNTKQEGDVAKNERSGKVLLQPGSTRSTPPTAVGVTTPEQWSPQGATSPAFPATQQHVQNAKPGAPNAATDRARAPDTTAGAVSSFAELPLVSRKAVGEDSTLETETPASTTKPTTSEDTGLLVSEEQQPVAKTTEDQKEAPGAATSPPTEENKTEVVTTSAAAAAPETATATTTAPAPAADATSPGAAEAVAAVVTAAPPAPAVTTAEQEAAAGAGRSPHVLPVITEGSSSSAVSQELQPGEQAGAPAVTSSATRAAEAPAAEAPAVEAAGAATVAAGPTSSSAEAVATTSAPVVVLAQEAAPAPVPVVGLAKSAEVEQAAAAPAAAAAQTAEETTSASSAAVVRTSAAPPVIDATAALEPATTPGATAAASESEPASAPNSPVDPKKSDLSSNIAAVVQKVEATEKAALAQVEHALGAEKAFVGKLVEEHSSPAPPPATSEAASSSGGGKAAPVPIKDEDVAEAAMLKQHETTVCADDPVFKDSQ
ncbi:unnamed protein product, partial [Amoebophrya sp. A120]|eukprot:GSA120T00007032001.1